MIYMCVYRERGREGKVFCIISYTSVSVDTFVFHKDYDDDIIYGRYILYHYHIHSGIKIDMEIWYAYYSI